MGLGGCQNRYELTSWHQVGSKVNIPLGSKYSNQVETSMRHLMWMCAMEESCWVARVVLGVSTRYLRNFEREVKP